MSVKNETYGADILAFTQKLGQVCLPDECGRHICLLWRVANTEVAIIMFHMVRKILNRFHI